MYAYVYGAKQGLPEECGCPVLAVVGFLLVDLKQQALTAEHRHCDRGTVGVTVVLALQRNQITAVRSNEMCSVSLSGGLWCMSKPFLQDHRSTSRLAGSFWRS